MRRSFVAAGPDSGVYLGWFDSEPNRNKMMPDHIERPNSLMGVAIEGASRIGHYFRPVYSSSVEGQADVKYTSTSVR